MAVELGVSKHLKCFAPTPLDIQEEWKKVLIKVVTANEKQSLCQLFTNKLGHWIFRFAKLNQMGQTIFSIESPEDADSKTVLIIQREILLRIKRSRWDKIPIQSPFSNVKT